MVKHQWHKFALVFDRLHVGRRGFYSIERLQALDDYCRDKSLLRVLAVCVVLALPALMLVVGMKFVPVQDPVKG